jgi:hypothetical protein
MNGVTTGTSQRLSGEQIADAICDTVRKALGRDCLLAGHLSYQGFHASGGLELRLQLDELRTVSTWIVIHQGALGRQVVEVSPAVMPGQLTTAEPVEVPEAAPSSEARQPVLVPAADMASVERLQALISENPGCCQNQLFQRSGMGRTRLFRLLNRYSGSRWTTRQNGQTREYYPLPSGSFL